MKYKKKYMVIFVIILCVGLTGCSSKKPKEDVVQQDILKEIEAGDEAYIDHNLYFVVNTNSLKGSSYLERKPEMTSFEIVKSLTEGNKYTAWCEITFEDEICRDVYNVWIAYERYDGGVWEHGNMGIDYSETQSTIKQPPSEECLRNMMDSSDGAIRTGEIIAREMVADTECITTLQLTNDDGIIGDVQNGTYYADLSGWENSVTAETKIILSYEGAHDWIVTSFMTTPPDIKKIAQYSYTGLLQFAKFFLNGACNIDSVELITYRVEYDGRYVFRFEGIDGYIELYMVYDSDRIELRYDNVDLQHWDYKYSGEDNGPLFFDPYPNHSYWNEWDI